jgi:hypothetical protein
MDENCLDSLYVDTEDAEFTDIAGGELVKSSLTVVGDGGKIRTPPVGGPPSPRDFITPLLALFISSRRTISSCC